MGKRSRFNQFCIDMGFTQQDLNCDFASIKLKYAKHVNERRSEERAFRVVTSINRRARKKGLEGSLKLREWNTIMDLFNGECPLTGRTDEAIVIEHFIPIGVGHGGSIEGNVYPLCGVMNGHKTDRHPFEWAVNELNNDEMERFEDLVDYIASKNGMSYFEFCDYVDWCFENKRSVEEAKDDPRPSVVIWRESK